jgi:DNA-binding transcriptional LysR family regulator
MEMRKKGKPEMELMQLEMFVALVEERSFQRAAERVFRTQPAVSIGVQKLEGSVGVPLLDRSQRQSGRLTPAGEILYECASRMLGLRDHALSVLTEKEEGSRAASLRIGVRSLDDFEAIPKLTRRFHAENPKIRLDISCDGPVNLFRQLADRRMDILLLSGKPKIGIQKKNVIVTQMRGARAHESFWAVRPRLGFSRTGYAFEECLKRQFEIGAMVRKLGRGEIRNISSAKTFATDRPLRVENTS